MVVAINYPHSGIYVAILYLWIVSIIFPSFTTCDSVSSSMQTVAAQFSEQTLKFAFERTCFKTISEKFKDHGSSVKQIDATKMMEEMRKDLINMLNWKKAAVERIAVESEKISSQYNYEKEIDYVGYYNMKSLYDARYKSRDNSDPFNSKSLDLSPHPNFGESLVNLDNSAVHVPINVYEKASDILNDIKWSEELTEVFKNNLAKDPSLSWQFLGSSKGFNRIYPATKWKVPHDPNGQSKTHTPDLYDCRVRQWYIQAAASPKNMVILLDISGSMTGLRKSIALNVVYNILETLNEDDYVIVLLFSNEIKFIHPCITEMVQATRRNINEIKHNIETVRTAEVANFTSAFITGFDTLKSFFKEQKGAQCNQAIALITDGAPETYESVFQEHNSDTSIRVFTYVIGREVTQIKEVYWMACNNRGYYAQVANLAEVREQVQQYIPVMSRPLVLSGQRIFTWTPVYTPYSEIQLTDWIWDERMKALKTRIMQQQSNDVEEVLEIENFADANGNGTNKEKENGKEKEMDDIASVNDEETNSDDIETILRKKLDAELIMAKRKKFQFMTTVSAPVFDQRKFINVTRKILLKNVYIDSDPEPIRIANLLGVAGTDVPVKEIEKMSPHYKLGVNGYSFVLTNNGKVLFHPDFRPVFQDMLKPFYSSVDLTEVELGNTTHHPRKFDQNIELIRSGMINDPRGSKKLVSKSFIDFMKRPTSRLQHYVYGKVDDTPFSFAIALPDPYGSYRFTAQVDLDKRFKENFAKYFSDNLWRIHPDWVYCENPNKISMGRVHNTSEEALLHFLNKELPLKNVKWQNSSNPPSSEHFSCDKDLLESLLFDAISTHEFSQCNENSRKKYQRQDVSSIDMVNAFISTRSGLTRYTNHTFSYNTTERSEYEPNSLSRSIEEVYYRRAVDYYLVNNDSFVFSVPFDAANRENEVVVTLSKAIFVGNGKMNAPVAVIGLQYNYSQFHSAFFRIAEKSNLHCKDDTTVCYVLDNNGFIMVSEADDKGKQRTGMFIGEVNDELLQDMVRVGIYRKVHFFDYQAICIDIINASSSAMYLLTPLNYLRQVFTWFASKLATIYLNMLYDSWFVALDDQEDYESESETSTTFHYNKTRPRSCDKEFDLYELNKVEQGRHAYNCKETCTRNYYIQPIPKSNLIILVHDKKCDCTETGRKIEMKQIIYNSSEMCEFLYSKSARKRPEACFNYHKIESEINYCGGSATLKFPCCLFSLLLLLLLIASR